MGRKAAKYLFRLDFMLSSVMFVAVFSILFMLIYSPFSMAAWFNVTEEQPMFVTIAFYIVAVATMLISKIAMRWVWQRYGISTYIYVSWLIVEAFVITWLYMGFTRVILPETVCTSEFTLRVFSCVVAILAIPYTIVSLYAAYRSQKEENAIIRYRDNLLGSGVAPTNLINLSDEKGVVKLTIDIDSLYYMESQDNYVKVCYENDGKLHNYMLRCRTKSIEATLANTTMLRCHRSFIVNTTKINLVRNDKSNPVVVLKHPDIKPIPVSKSYYDRVKALADSDAVQTAEAGIGAAVEKMVAEQGGNSLVNEMIDEIRTLISRYIKQ